MHNLRAQVFIDMDHGVSLPLQEGQTTHPVAVLFARVTKIKIFNYLGEVVITVDPKTLPLPGAR
jgi:hypothetical protein